ncbi:MAG: polyamine ABC transporter substrate-binding protein [Thermomicrobiales bacterium]|nr:polyamine ABC transporter substrate-binding protein [Thermomicrobiales bacterium]
MTMSRRGFLGAAGGAALAAVAPRGVARSTVAAQGELEDTLVFRSWGGALTDAIQEAWVDPFTAKTGVTVIMDSGDLPDVVIQQQAGNPQLDVVLTSRESLYWMKDTQSLLEAITPENVPNLADVYDVLRDPLNVSVPCFVGAYGIVYNTNQVATAPVSWLDLVNEAYAGHIVTGTGADGGWLIAAGFGAALGVDWMTEMDPVLDKFRELAPLVLTQYSSAGQMINLLEREDAWIGPWFNGRSWNAIDQGLPLGFAVPKEGAPAIIIDTVIPQGAQHPNAAFAFLDFLLTPQAQADLSRLFYYAPSNRKATVDPELAKKMPYGEDAVKQLIVPDWKKLAEVNPTLVEKWNEIFGMPQE